MFLLWHRSLTAINLSYTFPILETSATASCGTTGKVCKYSIVFDWKIILQVATQQFQSFNLCTPHPFHISMPGYTKILPPSIVVAGRHGCPFLWRFGQPTRAYNTAALGRVLAPWRPASPRLVPTDRRSSPKGGLIYWSLWILMALRANLWREFLAYKCGYILLWVDS